MAFPGEVGWIDKACPDHPTIKLIGEAMHSAAGWFLGTYCPECRRSDPSPHSRETHYYPSKDALLAAAFAGTLAWRDTRYQPAEFVFDGFVFGGKPPQEQPSDCYAVLCPHHGRVFLTRSNYNFQMCRPNARWECPLCGSVADFDDPTYEASFDD